MNLAGLYVTVLVDGSRRNRSELAILRRAVSAVVVTFVTGAVLVSSIPSQASPQDDKRRVDRQLRQTATQLSAANAAAVRAQKLLTEIAAKLPAAEAAAAKARGAAAAARVRRDIAKQRVVVLRAEAVAAALAYDQAQAEVEQAREQLDSFVSDAYKGGGANALTSMLDAKSPSDLAIQIATLRYVARGKDASLRNIELARLRSAQNRADVQHKKQLADQAAVAADKAYIASKAAEAAVLRAEQAIVNLVALRKSALATAERQRAAEAARYAALQRQSRAIAAILRAQAAADRRAGRSSQIGSGRLLTPVNGRISSTFGMRFDPVYHVWRLHAGVDFAAPRGTPIYAAAAGTVVTAGWVGGYGNYTCVSHGLYRGQGLASCYGHQSAILVRYGQHVGRGQLIGRVGTTGDSTGNHLHFEVRLDGRPVDPLPWL